jgi:hypothetical protein
MVPSCALYRLGRYGWLQHSIPSSVSEPFTWKVEHSEVERGLKGESYVQPA